MHAKEHCLNTATAARAKVLAGQHVHTITIVTIMMPPLCHKTVQARMPHVFASNMFQLNMPQGGGGGTMRLNVTCFKRNSTPLKQHRPLGCFWPCSKKGIKQLSWLLSIECAAGSAAASAAAVDSAPQRKHLDALGVACIIANQ
jgi:hypothetical protein